MTEVKEKNKFSFLFSAVKRSVIIPLVLVIAFLCIAASVSTTKTYIVYDGNETRVLNSTVKGTDEVIAELGIVIDESEYIHVPEENEFGVAEIYIYPKMKINMTVGGTASVLYSEKEIPLSELLSENNITVGDNDIVSLPLTTSVSDGMNVEIIRVTKSVVEETTALPFPTEKKPVATMTKGTSKVLQAGVDGSKKTVYEIEYRNGIEASRRVISETVIKAPVSKIVEYGTKPVDTSGVVTTWAGKKLNYSKKINMTATAYTTERTSDKVTATGKIAKVGLVAVDPRVIPLGSKLYIVSQDGKSWCYGTAVAADTGVRGNKIDLFFNTYKECISFGRRKATVYILK